MPTTITIPAKKARIQFGELINQAHYEGFTFVVTKQGRPVARIEGVTGTKKARHRRTPRFATFNLGNTDRKTFNRKTLYADRLTRTLGH